MVMAGPKDKPSNAHPIPVTADPINTLRRNGCLTAAAIPWLELNNGRFTLAVFVIVEKI